MWLDRWSREGYEEMVGYMNVREGFSEALIKGVRYVRLAVEHSNASTQCAVKSVCEAVFSLHFSLLPCLEPTSPASA